VNSFMISTIHQVLFVCLNQEQYDGWASRMYVRQESLQGLCLGKREEGSTWKT
jgi:hypothetical protein